ncbi:MAG: DNA recombination protein RmuC [Bacteroidales bacterium]|nr:DNA recombination protein RmuC [Bacteroidales bacterium]
MTTALLSLFIVFSLIIIILIIRVLIQLKNPVQMESVKESLTVFGNNLDKINNSMKDEFQRNREESSKVAKDNRDELQKSLESFDMRLSGNIKDFNENQRINFESSMTRAKEQALNIESRLEKMRETIENKLKEIQTDNSVKLEQMRETVNEKLQETLNTRISESFKMVTDQLEQVYKGLGDMQKLAVGVGDLKRVLSNVKTRGILGEIQLGSILEQYLSPEQFVKNVIVKPGTKESVEYAIKLPGNENPDEPVFLAIDSKFPIEDYQRLIEIYENIADHTKEEIIKVEKAFDASVVKSAKTIHQKYISPPLTTNFAIMFVPTEGLYAQILTRTGLFEQVQRDFNVTVVGPSNLVAFLSSLQMGFRTLAVQKRSNEVWQILGAVKTEFEGFEKVLEKAQNQIISASGNIEKLVGTRSRAIKRKLRNVQELPASEAARILESNEADTDTKDFEEENEEMSERVEN